MERKLIVTLLQKNIEELGMITEGFMEMNEYPAVIIQLARRKTEDVLGYIRQLEEVKQPAVAAEEVGQPQPVVPANEPVELPEEENEEINAGLADVEEIEVEEADGAAALDGVVALEEEGFNEPETAIEELVDELVEIEDDETVGEVDETIEEIEEELEEEITVELVDEPAQEETPATPEPERPRKVLADNKVENTIADLHSQKKIDDIRHAFSIGDRFRFQRELFAGNGELMNKTLSKLNQMNNFDEAIGYLHDKFQWNNDEDETVESFYQIVKRRYL